jgi:hypothetical protein
VRFIRIPTLTIKQGELNMATEKAKRASKIVSMLEEEVTYRTNLGITIMSKIRTDEEFVEKLELFLKECKRERVDRGELFND